jgi:hypothetical protein
LWRLIGFSPHFTGYQRKEKKEKEIEKKEMGGGD